MIKEKIKSLIAKQEGKDSKRKIENVVVLVLILIVTIIAINSIWNGKKENASSPKKEESNYGKELATNDNTTSSNTGTSMEQNLETILAKMEGVGKVKVLLSYSETSEVIAMFNENNKNSQIEEKDSGGGTRLTQQNDTSKEVIYKEVNGEKVPITQKVINPKMEGAIITATGANNAVVKSNIIQAVEAVTGLATHKIQVFEMKKE